MNLNTSLMLIGQRFGFSADELMGYASEDAIGGYHSNEALRKWPMGSLWEVEGKTLYALVRALRPTLALEVGTHRGASATHILAAMDANHIEEPYILEGCDLGDYGGDLIPEEYRSHVQIHHVNGVAYLGERFDGWFDLIFEDASHDAETTAAIAQLAQRKLAPGGVLVVHDAAHFLVGKDIRAGLDAANLPGGYGVYLCEPSDCGLAVWRKALEPVSPGGAVDAGHQTRVSDNSPEITETPATKVKRTPRKKAE